MLDRHTRPSHEPCPRCKVADEPRARGAAGASKSPLRRLSCTTACMRGRGGEPRTPERALTAGASRGRPEKALLSPASESSRRGAPHRSAKDTNVAGREQHRRCGHDWIGSRNGAFGGDFVGDLDIWEEGTSRRRRPLGDGLLQWQRG
jgi:hypothetical protein